MLTPTQQAVFKAAMIAETDPDVVAALAADNFPLVRDFYNAEGTFIVWKETTPVNDIFDAIVWKKMTPEDNPDGTVAFTNIALACQGRQFNIQTMLVGREEINSSKAAIRQGLNDALTGVPSGVAGATQAAGWNSVKTVMQRPATRLEALLATGDGTTGSPGDLVYSGAVTFQEVSAAYNS